VLGRYVELVRTREDVIPELVGGATLEEVEVSIEQSRTAFERLLTRLQLAAPASTAILEQSPETATTSQPAKTKSEAEAKPGRGIPAGGATRRSREELLAEEALRLNPTAKILLGLESK
jgi:hypothetical protein